MQSDIKIADSQRARAIDELNETKENYANQISSMEELCNSKLRAKDYEIEELRNVIEDQEVIAEGKVSDARQKLNRVEKTIA